MVSIISTAIIFLGIVNLFRMAISLIGSDIYGFRKHLNRNKKLFFYPIISVVIPVYNEEKSVIATISSVLQNNYPPEKVQIIVVNDGSTDATEQIIKDFIYAHQAQNVTIVSQANSGKAHALNSGIKHYATGELVMCLDADSYLAKNALINAVKYFNDKRVMAVASNVKIAKSKGLLNLIQIFEYILSYQMKKAQTAFNIEYIIGGVGSTFRRHFLEKINFYDTDTVTEDIDVTMKILRNGNKKIRVVYGSDIITYTQGALTIPDLIRQRHRWKWGRFQTFLKNKSMFFSNEKKYTKSFSWFYLPFTLYSDFVFFFEPLILLYILYLLIDYRDILTIISAVCVISFYMSINILAEETICLKERLQLIFLTPLMYFLFYILSFVEYVALIKSLARLPDLNRSLKQNKCKWTPIKHAGFTKYSTALDTA